MKEKELNNLLRNRARELGLCDQWYKEWSDDETMQQLLEKYLRGINFCIKHDYPKLEFARKVFPRDILIANGIFLDSSIDASNLMRSVVLGDSIGTLRYSGNQIGNIYVRHHANLRIEVDESSKVFVEAYDNCRVHVVAKGFSKAFVYWHGGEITYEGDVTIRDKRSAEKYVKLNKYSA